MNKLFWSETDLAIARARRWRSSARRPSCSTTRPGHRSGSTASSSPCRPDLRRTNEIQRNVVAEAACSAAAGLTGTVHFAFDEEQLEFRAQLRAFAEKQCTPSDLREAWASPLGWSRPRWDGVVPRWAWWG